MSTQKEIFVQNGEPPDIPESVTTKSETGIQIKKTELLSNTVLLPADIEEMAFRDILESKAREIELMLPDHMDINHFIKSAMMAVSRNPALANCSRKSLFMACYEAAEVGLDFTPAKGWAYIVPFKGQATFMPGYRGFIELATRTERISHIEAHEVFSCDKIEIRKGTNPEISHVMDITGRRDAVVIGAYAIATYANGQKQFDFMTIDELNKIQSRAKTQIVWTSDAGEMRKKTVVRRLQKYLPVSSDRMAKAMEYDDRVAGVREPEYKVLSTEEGLKRENERLRTDIAEMEGAE